MNQDLLISGILLHDLGKLQEFSRDPTGRVIDYSVSGVLLSHLVIGLLMLEEILKEMMDKNLAIPTEKEKLALFHIIEAHHGKPEYGSAVTPKFREAMLLHYLDQIDAKIWVYDQVQKNLEPGQMSEKKNMVWTAASGGPNNLLYRLVPEFFWPFPSRACKTKNQRCV